MLSLQVSIFFITYLDRVCCDGGIKSGDDSARGFSVENPLAEASPDFAYEPCKGSKGAVVGECQKEEEAGLALCNFPVP
jgi:hypothetical protein